MIVKAERLTATEIKGFIAAWLGWAFDGLDGYLYAMVAVPFVTSLLASSDASQAPVKASWIQGAFLVGWAIGGAVFGRIGDRLGRSRTLTLTILTYAVFTGMSFFAQTWWQLLIFRFISALGIGGEWAAGSALVAETLHHRHKAWASAVLQNGYVVGIIMAAVSVGFIGEKDHGRYVFLIGVIPALVTVWIRYAVPEPKVWQGEIEKGKMPKITDLFAPGVVKTTLLTLAMSSVCLTTVWALLFFNTQILKAIPEVKALPAAQSAALSRNVTIVFSLWNIVGCFVSSYLAKLIGYRKAFMVFLIGSGLSFLIGFHRTFTLESAKLWFDVGMFFSSGIFAIFPLYVPPLFPTLLRTTGAGFSYNFGRVIAAIGTVVGGSLVASVGPAKAVWYCGFLYIPGVLLAMFMPEVSDRQIEDKPLL